VRQQNGRHGFAAIRRCSVSQIAAKRLAYWPESIRTRDPSTQRIFLMANKDGRTATKPYRVRVGGVWYWVDPAVLRSAMEPGDIVLVYPRAGEPVLAILQDAPGSTDRAAADTIGLASLEGERFTLALGDIAALHLTAVDEVQ